MNTAVDFAALKEHSHKGTPGRDFFLLAHCDKYNTGSGIGKEENKVEGQRRGGYLKSRWVSSLPAAAGWAEYGKGNILLNSGCERPVLFLLICLCGRLYK